MTVEALYNGTNGISKVPATVPLRSGPPTMEELLVHYPARFTWPQLKTFISSGDLGLLKRDKKLQVRYDQWAIEIKKQYGSMINYLLSHRLQWGKPDTLSLLPSSLNVSGTAGQDTTRSECISSEAPEHFNADIPYNSDMICIIQNDWPYSVPPEIEHTLIWTRLPIFHPALIPQAIEARIQQDGLCGFTGSSDSVDSLPSLASCLPALSDWGITMDKLIRSPKGNDEEEKMIQDAGKEVSEFVKRRWIEREWETGWFVNPPRLQSVPGLAHIHVFARKKSLQERVSWDTWISIL